MSKGIMAGQTQQCLVRCHAQWQGRNDERCSRGCGCLWRLRGHKFSFSASIARKKCQRHSGGQWCSGHTKSHFVRPANNSHPLLNKLIAEWTRSIRHTIPHHMQWEGIRSAGKRSRRSVPERNPHPIQELASRIRPSQSHGTNSRMNDALQTSHSRFRTGLKQFLRVYTSQEITQKSNKASTPSTRPLPLKNHHQSACVPS